MQNIANTKEIIIDNLPDGYSKEQLQKLVKNSSVANVNVVAVVGYANDWSAYIGFPLLFELNDQDDENMYYYCTQVRFSLGVASNGDKLSEREAKEIFGNQFDHLYYSN